MSGKVLRAYNEVENVIFVVRMKISMLIVKTVKGDRRN